MTHEFLALMLGVRRQTVSAVAQELSRQGWIVYRRGFIRIADRTGLEGATCECYAVIRDEFARLVGPPDRTNRSAGLGDRDARVRGLTGSAQMKGVTKRGEEAGQEEREASGPP